MKQFSTFVATGIAAGFLITALPVCADHPSLSINNGVGGPIIGLSAATLPAGKSSFSVKREYLKNDTFSDHQLIEFGEADEDVHNVDSLDVFNFSGAWGVTDNLTIGFSLPVVNRNNITEAPHHDDEGHDEEHEDEHEAEHDDEEEGSIEALGDSKGLGDITLYGQYRFYQNATEQRTASVYFGLKLPTGKTDEKNEHGDSFEAEHQPGSGSLDALLGLAYGQPLGYWMLNTSLLATLAQEGTQQTDLGNALNYDIALSRMLASGHDDHHHTHSSWFSNTTLVIELNGEWRDRADIDGSDQTHTGGNLVYLSPGLTTQLGDDWTISFSAGVPLVENLNGEQSEPDWRTSLTLARPF